MEDSLQEESERNKDVPLAKSSNEYPDTIPYTVRLTLSDVDETSVALWLHVEVTRYGFQLYGLWFAASRISARSDHPATHATPAPIMRW
jgi:hypothetical protein